MLEQRLPRYLIDRRIILIGMLSTAVIAPFRDALPAEGLYILPQDDIRRLKADFNAHLTEVRLIFLLSPT